jgi:hypothetical protein
VVLWRNIDSFECFFFVEKVSDKFGKEIRHLSCKNGMIIFILPNIIHRLSQPVFFVKNTHMRGFSVVLS